MSDSLNRVLTALNHAEPPAGLQQRVLRQLSTRTSHLPHHTSTKPALPRWLALPAMGCAAILAAAAFILHHAGTPQPAPARVAQQHDAESPRQPVSPTQRATAFVSPTAYGRVRPPQQARFLSVPEPIPAPTAAADPAYLPSFPAPEIPLTQQERTLRRLARHTHLTDVAQLETPGRQQAALERYLQHALSPLVTAESFSPTPATPEPIPNPDSAEPSSSDTSTNPQ